ncbi:MAG: ASCH domain-containing protein [Lactobacillus sp.]|jgi:uncharacterized protein YhfF|nr:ASCH domain-containing protein [Lactobacillus sp.]MCI2034170.1 ASCH domain-containing protein [Lactobacillus sp.]
MPTITDFFATAKEALALDPRLTYRRAEPLASEPQLASQRLQAALAGELTSLVYTFAQYHQAHEGIPEAYDINVALDGNHQPQAVLYTENVYIHLFNEVSAKEAQRFGLSLADWQAQYRTELALRSDSEMVIIEHFRVLYPF